MTQIFTDNESVAAPDVLSEAYLHDDVTREIIAAAYEVHKVLGGGFLERVYENALVLELTKRGLQARSQAPITVSYKGDAVGQYFADLIVNGAVICEIKAGEGLSPAHKSQLLNYLKATNTKVGLLVNFGRSRVQVKRMVF